MMSLQGFNRVTAASALISGQALLEIVGTLLVFKAGIAPGQSYLRNMGLVTLSSALIAACVGTTAPCCLFALASKCTVATISSCRL